MLWLVSCYESKSACAWHALAARRVTLPAALPRVPVLSRAARASSLALAFRQSSWGGAWIAAHRQPGELLQWFCCRALQLGIRW